MRDNALYVPYLVSFMSFFHGIQYEKDHVFIDEEIAEATATDVERYMRMKAYGSAERVAEDRPTLCRSNTLEVIKRSISFFIPNRIPPWDPVSRIGNPTKSVEVNQLIKEVRKHEVRTEGATSRIKRAMSRPEFCTAINLFSLRNDFLNKYRTTCMMKLQYHLIARSYVHTPTPAFDLSLYR